VQFGLQSDMECCSCNQLGAQRLPPCIECLPALLMLPHAAELTPQLPLLLHLVAPEAAPVAVPCVT
jgi:hypothetical protein